MIDNNTIERVWKLTNTSFTKMVAATVVMVAVGWSHGFEPIYTYIGIDIHVYIYIYI